ncbi:MAG: hypothetical protein M1837_005746 [Sclerophora amabilis]|nr:MAG: hypothetical protein M1837_005746 [Sclerophora amabilis]
MDPQDRPALAPSTESLATKIGQRLGEDPEHNRSSRPTGGLDSAPGEIAEGDQEEARQIRSTSQETPLSEKRPSTRNGENNWEPKLNGNADTSSTFEPLARQKSSHRNGHIDAAPSHDEERQEDSESDDSPDGSLECKWDGDDDPMNPRNLGLVRKWLIVIIVSTSSLCVTCTSSLYTSTYEQIMPEFGCSRIVATLGLSLFVVGLGLGPLFLAPLSEFYGRRPIYIWSFSLFVIWMVPCAVARNIETMLIARFLSGVSGSAFLSVAGGTVGDIFGKTELQAPMMIYTASPFIGPELGPLIGGFVNHYTTWRWSFYLLLIWSGAMLLSIVVFVPETYHPVLLRQKAERLRRDTGNEKWRAPIEKQKRSIPKTVLWSLIRPFQLLALEPMCLNLCLFSAILLGVLYLFFGAFNLVFTTNHDFQQWQVGLSFLGILVGMLCGIATDPYWHKYYQRLVQKREAEGGEAGGSEPEFRLPPAVAGAFLIPVGLFWFGWTTYRSVHWIVPIIGSAIFGMGTLLVFSGTFTFLVDAYPLYAASALGANSATRSSFAAAFPLFGIQSERRDAPCSTTLLDHEIIHWLTDDGSVREARIPMGDVASRLLDIGDDAIPVRASLVQNSTTLISFVNANQNTQIHFLQIWQADTRN